MTANLDLLCKLRQNGVRLVVKGDSIVAKPKTSVSAEHITMLREQKRELIAILSGKRDTCKSCGGNIVRDRTHDGYWNRYCLDCGEWFTCQKD